MLAARARARAQQRGDSGFAAAGGADDERARATFDSAAEQCVEPLDATRQLFAAGRLAMLGGDQPRVNLQATRSDRIVVVAAAKIAAAELGHAQAPALDAEVGDRMLEEQRTMGDALDLEVVLGRRQVVEHQHRTAPSGEKLLESQD